MIDESTLDKSVDKTFLSAPDEEATLTKKATSDKEQSDANDCNQAASDMTINMTSDARTEYCHQIRIKSTSIDGFKKSKP